MTFRIFNMTSIATFSFCLLISQAADAQYSQYQYSGGTSYPAQSFAPTYDVNSGLPTSSYNQAQAYSQPQNVYQTYGNGQGGYQQPAQQSSQPSSSLQSSIPTYQQPIGQVQNTQYDREGNRYQTYAGGGLDQRSSASFGGNYYGGNDKFVGAQASAGAGFYGDAGVSQQGYIGNVPVTNYAEGNAFVGVQGDARAGLNQDGLVVGVEGFAGGRVSGTVGSEIGAVGYGATGEAWSGIGAEAGVNAGFNNGVLRFDSELGVAVGVGGKVGVQGSLDVGQVGRDMSRAGQDIGNWTNQANRDINRWGQQAGRDVGNWSNQAGRDIGKAANNVGRDVGNAVNNVGKGIGNASKGVLNLFKGR